MYIEFEVKFYIDLDDFYAILKKLSAQLVKKNTLMRRMVFASSKDKNSQIRVRDEGGDIRLSYKTYDMSKEIDSMQEVDVLVNDFEKACEILTLLGLKKMRYVENYREVFQINDCLIMIDLWPGLLPFIEVESESKESVEQVCQKLGLCMGDAMYGPTSKLYEQVYGITRTQFDAITELTFQRIPEIFKNAA